MLIYDHQNITEMECQAIAYVKVRKAFSDKYTVRAGYRIRGTHGGRGACFDLALFDKWTGQLLLVVEIKRIRNTVRGRRRRNTAQHQRYLDLADVPVVFVRGLDECMQIVPRIRNVLRSQVAN